MQEMWDVYDQYRNKLEKMIRRGEELSADEFHLVVHVWIKNKKGQYLIQKRAANKTLPNMWAVTGGAVTAGEDSQLGMIREVEEELGLTVDLNKASIVFSHKTNQCFADIWLVEQEFDLSTCKLQEEEVSDCKWVNPKEIVELVKNKKFVNYNYLDYFIEI